MSIEDEAPRLDFTIAETTLKVEISPSPTEFLLTSPNMTISCSGLNFIKPLAIGLTPFIKELRGNIDHKLPRQDVGFDIPLPQTVLGDQRLNFALKQTEQAIVLGVK